jgi:hypothetical protein
VTRARWFGDSSCELYSHAGGLLLAREGVIWAGYSGVNHVDVVIRVGVRCASVYLISI